MHLCRLETDRRQAGGCGGEFVVVVVVHGTLAWLLAETRDPALRHCIAQLTGGTGTCAGAGGMLWGGAATCPALEEASADCVCKGRGGAVRDTP